MATEITRGAPGAITEETVTADTTVDGEESGGLEGYAFAGIGPIPIPVTDPGSAFYPKEDTLASAGAASATEDTSSNVA